jgi:anti-anti-sigma factor
MPRRDGWTPPHTPDFEIHEQRDERGAVRLALWGELDLAVAEQLQARLRALARAHATVTLDLSELQFIDGTGLQVLITQFDNAAQTGWELRIDPTLTRQVRGVIELVGIERILSP